jgi:hypothetical protein
MHQTYSQSLEHMTSLAALPQVSSDQPYLAYRDMETAAKGRGQQRKVGKPEQNTDD